MEGEQFGQTADQRACYDFALTRHQTSFMQSEDIFTEIFLGACLKTSKPTGSFCVQFPDYSPYFKKDSEDWLNTFCVNKISSKTKCKELTKQAWQVCRERAGLRN